MSDILDLDALMPPSRQVKINGKLYECKPLTIRQLINVTRLEQELTKIETAEEIMPIIKKAFTPFMPQIAEDENIDFTVSQMKELIKFAQTISTAEPESEAKKYDDPKKKIPSVEESPTSSASTKATPSKKSSTPTQ